MMADASITACVPPVRGGSAVTYHATATHFDSHRKATPMIPAPFLHVVVALGLFVAAQAAPVLAQGADAAAVATAVRDFHAALEAGDTAAVSRLLAPDAVVLEGGDRETRKEYLEHHLQADIKFAQATTTRQGKSDVTVSGDAAWASSTSVTQGTFQSKPVDLVNAELMVLSKTPAGWVIRAIHWSSRKSR
jgi:ketosteroid isomerase-like protein